MHRVHTEVDMLGTVTATDRSLRPSDSRLIIAKYRSLRSLRKTKIIEELKKINHLLSGS